VLSRSAIARTRFLKEASCLKRQPGQMRRSETSTKRISVTPGRALRISG
jgi:hypothetical protein